MISVVDLPKANACLNALSAIFLVSGFAFIRRKNVLAHKACMLTAFVLSVLFLASYLYYHAHAGIVYFKGVGPIRTLYLSILATHTVLAAVVPVLAIITLTYALKGLFASHKKIAVFTLPVWLYVSVTGVVVYWMLFH